MYMDGYVAYGLIIVAATCVVAYGLGRFAWRHFKEDVAKHEQA